MSHQHVACCTCCIHKRGRRLHLQARIMHNIQLASIQSLVPPSSFRLYIEFSVRLRFDKQSAVSNRLARCCAPPKPCCTATHSVCNCDKLTGATYPSPFFAMCLTCFPRTTHNRASCSKKLTRLPPCHDGSRLRATSHVYKAWWNCNWWHSTHGLSPHRPPAV